MAAIGYYLCYGKGTFPKAGAAMIFLATIIVGASIFLVMQMYQKDEYFRYIPLIWGLAILPLAYVVKFRSILFLSLINLLIWIGIEAEYHISSNSTKTELIPLVLLGIFGIALCALGLFHACFDSLQKLASPIFIYGTFMAFFAGFILTFELHSVRFGIKDLSDFYITGALIFISAVSVYLYVQRKD